MKQSEQEAIKCFSIHRFSDLLILGTKKSHYKNLITAKRELLKFEWYEKATKIRETNLYGLIRTYELKHVKL